ncbi:hypothetical protein ACRQ1B_28240 [Rhizobium panacihumi]|uniref:hypothetical protein n=1 Tax=Rhizobium panacihumi TaxID=2008450 RepID=UPI003D7A9570
MGQAKQKAKLLDVWKSGLSGDEMVLFDAAYKLHNNVIKSRNATGMCYHSVFFLYLHLKEKHGIDSSPVIAYVNDGTDDIFISHAWLEFNGKRTDVSLAVTDPRIGVAGQLIILDRVFKAGHEYGYFREIPEVGLKKNEELCLSGMRTLLERKEKEHHAMLKRVGDDSAIRAYLDAEPNGFNFEKIASLL